jgi:competence protein ComEA
VWQRVSDFINLYGARRIAASAAVACVLAVGAWWLVRVPPAPVESAISFTSTSVSEGTVQSVGQLQSALQIVVHVAGEVRNPGVYELPPGSRIIDAVNAAGGITARADVEVINLATPLIDSSQVYVPAKGSVRQQSFARPQPGMNVGASTDSQQASSGLVNINRATAAELEKLPGVGPSTAQAIIDYRSSHGPFASPEDLLNVKGIGPSKFAAMQPLVGV